MSATMTPATSRCPFMSGFQQNTSEGMTNRDWWPDQVDLAVPARDHIDGFVVEDAQLGRLGHGVIREVRFGETLT